MKQAPIVSIILAAAVSACAGSQNATPAVTSSSVSGFGLARPERNFSWIARDVSHTKSRLVYVADEYANTVFIYRQRGHNQQPVGQLKTDITFPVSLWVDTHRNLWVANINSELESSILRFPQGSTTPNLVLQDANWNIVSVWVALDGAVYAVNMGYYANCEIVKYPPHENTPRVIGDQHLNYVTSVVGDSNGNLFASGLAGSGGEIDERPAGSRTWHDSRIQVVEPFDMAFDKSGNLVVADDETIKTFPPGHTTPSNSTSCSSQCVSIAFNFDGGRVWVDEFNNSNGAIEERTYPSGTLLDSLPQPQGSAPDSVAVSPDLYP